MTRHPNFLDGMHVLDLAGPLGAFCSKLLADLGAKVTRVEWGGGSASCRHDPFSYAYYNLNKQIITQQCDHHSQCKTWFSDLICKTDILISTVSVDNDPIDVRHSIEVNPQLIHVSITPFGISDSRCSHAGSNAVISAYGGHTYITGSPDEPPLTPYGNQSHYAASLFGANAALLALRQRELTGRGQFIDISAQEALVSTLDHVMVDYFASGSITHRQGAVYGAHAFAILPCKDGFVQITIEQNWDTLVELMGAEDMASDLGENCWCNSTYRKDNFDYILDIVGAWTSLHTKNDLFELGQAMRFPWAPICTIDDVISSPHLASRQFMVSQKDAPFQSPGAPYRFTISEPTHGRGPLLRKNKCTSLLKGIRVLDFTWMLAGPYATRVLADYGAEVIKVQSHRTAKGAEDNETTYFATWNRNKQSITVDMDTRDARQTILTLAAQCDIVVENFTPRIMAGWGLTYDTFRQINPDIIMASISAMGQTGPWRDYVGFAPTFHALSGLTSETSKDLAYPVCLGHAYGDTIIGLYGTLAILSALRHRDSTGCGSYIDLSGYEALCTLMGPAIIEATGSIEPACDVVMPSASYPCLGIDTWCVIELTCADHWQALCDVPGLESLRNFFLSEKSSGKRIYDTISDWTKTHTPDDVVHILHQAKIPVGVVCNAKDIAENIRLRSRDFFINLLHPTLGPLRSDRTPLFHGRSDPSHWKPAPLLGADNELLHKP